MKFTTVISFGAAASTAMAAPFLEKLARFGGAKAKWIIGNQDDKYDGRPATPDQVVNASDVTTGGLEGSKGWFLYGINADEDVICYNITTQGFRGDYQSPAVTATHIHQGEKGKNGLPRIAFPNPEPIGDGNVRRSLGCLKGPFRTGVMADGRDTGEGFTVAMIEKDPAGFFTDSHSSLAVAGAFRGQLGCRERQ
ncbi:hypothetical protein PspLS_01157 [Pyricularia sp. CBS 133598]|nr:hypothetical protein PspLS_01157 [Pyricularia sp. CBS 133598]